MKTKMIEKCDCCKLEAMTEAHEFLGNEFYLCKDCVEDIKNDGGRVKILFAFEAPVIRPNKATHDYLISSLEAIQGVL